MRGQSCPKDAVRTIERRTRCFDSGVRLLQIALKQLGFGDRLCLAEHEKVSLIRGLNQGDVSVESVICKYLLPYENLIAYVTARLLLVATAELAYVLPAKMVPTFVVSVLTSATLLRLAEAVRKLSALLNAAAKLTL